MPEEEAEEDDEEQQEEDEEEKAQEEKEDNKEKNTQETRNRVRGGYDQQAPQKYTSLLQKGPVQETIICRRDL